VSGIDAQTLAARTRARLTDRPRRVVPPGPLIRAAVLVPIVDLHAALREAHEEVALPPTSVEPLGVLDDTETFATQYVITPWVGLVHGAVAWQPDAHEVDRVIEVPVGALLARGCFRVEQWERAGIVRDVYFYDYGDTTIWGATARILKQYLDIVESE